MIFKTLFVSLLLAQQIACFSNAVLAFDAEHINVAVILDKSVLRFPEPIYGFARITNTSSKPMLFPAFISGEIVIEVDGVTTNEGIGSFDAVGLNTVPPGYTLIRPFLHRIYDKTQIEAILREDSPIEISLSVEAIPKTDVPNPKTPGVIDYHEANGFHRKKSPAATLKYSKIRSVFKDDADANFANKVRDPQSWPKQGPTIPYKPPLAQLSGNYQAQFTSNVTRIDDRICKDVPIARLFDTQLSHLQSAVRCDTATWRLLEIYRLRQTCHYLPQVTETYLRAMADGINVVKCAGRAEAYYLSQLVPWPYGTEIVINGKRSSVHDYYYDRLHAEVPFLKNRANEMEIACVFGGHIPEISKNPILLDIAYSEQKIWNPAINDLSQPSPLETSLKRAEETGEPNPCPCYDVQAEAQLQNEFSNPKALPK